MRNKKQNQNDNLNYLNGGGFAARPKTLLCSICGREFGTASLEIHQKTCIKKYQNDLANMDPGHRMQMPSNHVKIRTRKKLSLIRTKSCQVISFLRITIVGYGVSGSTIILMSKCRKCGRRFNPDRIRKHESVCIGPEPDVQRIKQRQEEMNKRAAKQLRPKKTGKWREDHLEFQQAMREMRKIRQQEIAEGRGNPFGNQHGQQQGNYGKSYGNSYGNQGNSYGNSQMNYGRPPSKQQPKNYPKQTQQTTKNIPKQPNYTQSVKVSHKQPNFQLEQQQMKLHSRSPMVQKPVQQQQTRSSVDRGGYGRPANQGGGGASYQIANSNVSTFSLFTSDGLPKRYDNFQANNPYAKKNGLY